MSHDDFVPLRGIRLGPARSPEKGRASWVPPLALMQAWCQVVRPPLSEHARPCAWLGGVLSVEVDEPRWRRTLEELEADLRAQINAWLGCDAVREVRVEGAS